LKPRQPTSLEGRLTPEGVAKLKEKQKKGERPAQEDIDALVQEMKATQLKIGRVRERHADDPDSVVEVEASANSSWDFAMSTYTEFMEKIKLHQRWQLSKKKRAAVAEQRKRDDLGTAARAYNDLLAINDVKRHSLKEIAKKGNLSYRRVRELTLIRIEEQARQLRSK